MKRKKTMKKYIFLLVLLIAGYWGFSQGDIDTKNSHPSPSVLQTVEDKARTFISGMSNEKTPSGSLEVTAPAAVPTDNDLTMLETIQVYRHFKPTLEAKVDRKKFVPSDHIPDILKKAIVATEDRRFYEHGAVDPIGVVRAMITNYAAGRTLEGGSTITQQTVKNIFLSNERTMERKVQELVLAVALEKNYDKDEILTLYLNTIYFGHGAYGIGEASRTYFGKDPKNLTLQEAALLAGLPQAPSAYDPLEYPEEAQKRMTTVLALMAAEGYITPEQAAKTAISSLLKK